MDFIARTKKKSVLTDKSLWQLTLAGAPMYNDLISTTFKKTVDSPAQQMVRAGFPTREAWVTARMLAGVTRPAATDAWNTMWQNHEHPPPTGLYPNPRDMGTTLINGFNVPNPDFYGYGFDPVLPAADPRGYRERTLNVPHDHYRQQWLNQNPLYRYEGWNAMPGNWVIRRVPPAPIPAVPAAPAGGGGGGGGGP